MLDYPVRFYIGNHEILLHTFLEGVGIFVGMRLYYFFKRRKKDTVKLSTNTSLSLLAGATLGAFLGSHLLGCLENVPQWMASPNKKAYFLGNMTVVGGFLGGLMGVELAKMIVGEKSKTGDLFTYPLIVALIIGRIGCFSAGIYEETYGVTTSLPWGMDLGDGLKRHPVNLYEILFLVVLGFFIRYCQKKYELKDGATFKIFMISYLFFRFLLDFIKPGWRYCLGLGSIQLACIAGLIYYGKYIVKPILLTKNEG
ncbi:MAG: diacylglyceryl transferase [Pseudopedobacter saltans]|uniref:Diacylglyceryl transferase n=1 Tax=Pseudopedobacter saltans TaxID=151895 RepID=A0A2W5H521_9SPHI|nr:MAG: diacylglyceryl transferase [Pseudopedobacter saltans]